MPSNILNCVACCLPYNLSERLPKLLSSCGHTICLACLSKICNGQNPRRCPVDKTQFPNSNKSIDCFLTNLTVLQLIEPEVDIDCGSCKEHSEPNNLVCINDRCKICKHCGYYGVHKSHELKHVNDIKSEAQLKINKLEALVRDAENDDRDGGILLEQIQKTITSLVNMKFERVKQIIEDKLQQINRDIALFFTLEEVKMEDKLHADLAAKKVVQEKINDLSDISFNEKFFSAFEDKEVEKLFPTAQYRRLLSSSQDLHEALERCLDNLESSISSQVQLFQIKFPSHETAEGNTWPKKKDNSKIVALKSFFKIEEDNGSLFISPREGFNISNDVFGFEAKIMRKVSLELSKSQPSEVQIKAIRYLWNEFEDITDVSVDLSYSTCSDHELSALCLPYFWATEKVQKLSLNLYKTDIADQTLIEILRAVATEMLNLKHVYLQLGCTKITDKSFQTFPKYMLPSTSDLESFQLDLSYTQVTDVSMEQMCLNLKEVLKDTHIFALNLTNTLITDKTIYAFVKHTLPAMKNLENFLLYLGGTHVTDSSIKQLFSSLKSRAKTLKAFGISLGGTKLTDKAIDALSQSSLPLMSSLERFELYLGKTQVTDSSTSNMLKTLKNINKGVKILIMGLDAPKITDKSVESLVEYLLMIRGGLADLKLYLEDGQVSDHNKKVIADIQCDLMSRQF